MHPQSPDPEDDSARALTVTPSDDKVVPEVAPGPLARAGVVMIRGYQRYLSPLKPPVCRFIPSCSEYTRIAILRYGFFRGAWLGARRISRCHPLHPGGYDPVP
jgi:putative membrane protein insertion efficiency factor